MSALLLSPPEPRWLFVLAHGAGAGMHHPFMESVASRLLNREIATFRYQFPYMEKGRRRPDPPGILTAAVRAACAAAVEALPGVPLLAGGKSMGGRMTSLAASRHDLGVRGLAFFGFPLHPAGRPSTERADHLRQVSVPMLFLQGTRDRLADLELLRPVCDALEEGARLHVVDEADHSFRVTKRSGRTYEEILEELAEVTTDWAGGL